MTLKDNQRKSTMMTSNNFRLLTTFLFASLALACAASEQAEQATQAADERPNIIIILMDDTGFADWGAYGSEISTPNIDRLASNGMMFTNFHAAAACSPTRAPKPRTSKTTPSSMAQANAARSRFCPMPMNADGLRLDPTWFYKT